MRQFATEKEALGHQFIYLKIGDENNKQTIEDNLKWLIKKYEITHFQYQVPDEYRLDEELKRMQLPCEKEVFGTEHFLCGRKEFQEIFKGKKTMIMESFYRKMRVKYQILIETKSEPVGGKWNYDAENRNKYKEEVSIPNDIIPFHNLREIYEEIQTAGVETIGSVDAEKFNWPISRAEALDQLNHFIAHKLEYFGKYQDALYTKHAFLFHSRISFALNTKLLHPLEVVQAVEAAYLANPTSELLNQVEGFIRQILGWREYMRGVYWAKMPEYAQLNYFNHKTAIPDWFWTGNTKMNCLHHAITQSLETAYAHHIQRLMVLGNFALLAGIDPKQVNEWFLIVYADAYEWVELPNVSGMILFADGGYLASKPYAAGGNYINKMSNYCKNCSYNGSSGRTPKSVVLFFIPINPSVLVHYLN
jgi:deoxyribodipyrimidine photolyase-related protein